MLNLSHPIGAISGVGPKTAAIFRQHALTMVEDLLYFFPRAWIDASRVTPLSEARVGTSALFDVTVAQTQIGRSQKRRLAFIRALLADESGSVEAVWFGQPWLNAKLKVGSRHLLYGRLQRWRGGERVLASPLFFDRPQILPVYPQIGGLNSDKIRRLMAQILPSAQLADDHLDDAIRAQLGVIDLVSAIKKLHNPNSLDDIVGAKDRFGLEELIMTAVPSILAKLTRERETTTAISFGSSLDAWLTRLPFSLTNDQQAAMAAIMADLGQTRPMNRLLQGDVGSGKTVVALAAALAAIAAGKRVVWLAPTELVANQHFATIRSLAPSVLAQLWTRSNKNSAATITAELIVGTHAILFGSTTIRNLGLLIIDEQHRFGVKQRALLRRFSGQPTHLLSMTATPIPRTMALTIYGDLDVSTIKSMPVGRKPVKTKVVEQANRLRAYEFVDKHIAAGFGVFVVCPTIEPSSDEQANVFVSLFQSSDETKAVTTWSKHIQTHFPGRRVAQLHGKMKTPDKQRVMDEFRIKKIDIVVATSVVEVGVDVPHATIMMIESAERFGLATLHQLRGRVGRGDHQSFCFLFPSSDDKAENSRLRLLESTTDGFALAEADLKLRGPGELTGVAQSGLPRLRFASFDDVVKIEKIKNLLPQLVKVPKFKAAVERFWRMYHPE